MEYTKVLFNSPISYVAKFTESIIQEVKSTF